MAKIFDEARAMSRLQKKKDILLVEDDPKNLKLVKDLLEACGYSVIVANNGREGLEIAKTSLPDLILMDVQLPGIDGLEATKRLKADEKTRIIPIIALTAYAMEGDKERIRRAGCDEYVPKPINIIEFLKKVEAFL